MNREDIIRILVNHYGFHTPQVESIVLYENMGKLNRGVWKVVEGKQTYALKHAFLFNPVAIYLTEWLHQRNLSPMIIKTKNGKLFIEEQGLCFFLSEWVEGSWSIDNPLRYMGAVASFHRLAQFPEKRKIKSSYYILQTKMDFLGIYVNLVRKIRSRLNMTKDSKRKQIFSEMANLAEEKLTLLGSLNVEPYIRESLKKNTIVHGDLNFKNILFHGETPKFIDLDGVNISTQVHDFPIIITTLFDMNLPPDQLDFLLDIYFQTVPLAFKYRHIYFAVCQFPCYFIYSILTSELYYQDFNIDSDYLMHLYTTELKKNQVINRWK